MKCTKWTYTETVFYIKADQICTPHLLNIISTVFIYNAEISIHKK